MRKTLMAMTLTSLLMSANALALGRLADVQIVDRDSGQTLETHYSRGEYWVAGRPGARYAIRVTNRSGERLLAVAAVDGVNVISGDTAGFDQQGYIFAPGQGYDIDGWRKSQEQVAAFTFTDAGNSYAQRTGRPLNIGVIGVALFGERRPPQVQLEAPQSQSRDAWAGRALGAHAAAAPAPSNEPSARLGTGHGERENSRVEYASFERDSGEPREVVRIRYDSLENLVAMGVVRRPTPRWPQPQAFPESPGRFVPDPPG